MTNKHDGPRPGSRVTVLQSATPTRHTATEADELDRLISAYANAKFKHGVACGVRASDEERYEKDADEALRALYDWQLAHGLGSK